ncbi:Fusaric acid resistance protein-like-domain-containing protein [Yarrowia lipolytica]|jgi:hypothetical protein|nr:Fusaric acid resistance protein-like-domain-containing protein [Yarrowia lipolytica]RDW35792.1 Fusaric acid resistance protein-like-domain-containing protein [Yarrowia lipolytica]RDW41626.1 Fusaric acid resistance protein-like-domain-containing protein [Yarrowia lipolytica]RDW46996.1 Fusaric acid resistance protein-like-domain-containing protein [Yarrowia lipolytica]RDW54424.1 Fusaric acid resistance protein-like-domain-containing protein [Yarrowia lipolytica]
MNQPDPKANVRPLAIRGNSWYSETGEQDSSQQTSMPSSPSQRLLGSTAASSLAVSPVGWATRAGITLPLFRKASMILPNTGQRVRRQVTFSNEEGRLVPQTIKITPEELEALADANANANANANNFQTTYQNYNSITEFGEPNSSSSPNSPEPDPERSFNYAVSTVDSPTMCHRHKPKPTGVFGKLKYYATGAWIDPEAKVVLKCSVGYLLGTVFVYNDRLSRLLGNGDSKHMVATSVIYFHPGRTMGSMVEALIFASIALLYSFCVCSLSMLVSAFLVDLHMRLLAYIIDLVIFCAVGLGTLAFVKQKMDLPTFNTATSLACVCLVSVLTKEGNVQQGRISLEQLNQIFLLAITGCTVSALVCVTLWRTSAVTELKQSISNTMDIYGDMLLYLTRQFMRAVDVDSVEYIELKAKLRAQLSCFRNIRHAKLELYLTGREDEYHQLEKLVHHMNSIHQHLNALTSGVETEHSTLTRKKLSQLFKDSPIRKRHSLKRTLSTPGSSLPSPNFASTKPNEPTITPENLFDVFLYHLGPPMKSFSLTMKRILHGSELDKCDAEADVAQYQRSLGLAEELFCEARKKALAEVYGLGLFKRRHNDEFITDWEQVAASCGNFSLLLEEMASEVQKLLGSIEGYLTIRENDERSYRWLWGGKHREPTAAEEAETSQRSAVNKIISGRKTMAFMTRQSDLLEEGFAGRMHDDLNSALTKKAKHGELEKPSMSFRLWKRLRVFRRRDVQFGIRVGIGAAMFATPAYMPSLQPIFYTWRGEWGLISYVVIMSKSVGGTTWTAWKRIIGTFLGAMCAYVSWVLFPENEYMLALIGAAISYPCFRIIVTWKDNNAFGRFVLLTFNITAVYSYSLYLGDNDNDDDEGGLRPLVGTIAFHRFVSVCAGVMWAFLVTVLLLPNKARVNLKHGLCSLWLRMGLTWKDPLASQFDPATGGYRLVGLAEQPQLQNTLIQLDGLLKHAPNEFRLKGRFPKNTYDNILKSTQKILDAFQNLRLVIEKDPTTTPHEAVLLKSTLAERTELSHRIFLRFYMLASAMKLGFPFPDNLPSTKHSRDRMMVKLNIYRGSQPEEYEQNNVMAAGSEITDNDFALLYIYILVCVTITSELEILAKLMQDLFGVIDEEMFDISYS